MDDILEAVNVSLIELKKLILDRTTTINQFKIDDSFIHKFQNSKNNNRVMELKSIASFFGSLSNSSGQTVEYDNSEDAVHRITCAMQLNRYWQEIGTFIDALHHLQLHHLVEHIKSNEVYMFLIRINGDFKICESPDMLDRLKIGLGFLTISEIQVLQKIGAANFSIVLEFLKHEGVDFELSLESACERAARDPIVSEILFKLQSVYPLLVLFVRISKLNYLRFLKWNSIYPFTQKKLKMTMKTIVRR
jgi:hypothetical protein